MGQIIIGVPGCWKGRDEIIAAIAQANTGADPRYLALGMVLTDLVAGVTFGFEVADRHPAISTRG